jgi:hypothetical protein
VAPAASGEAEKPPCYVERMKTAVLRPEMLSDDALLARVHELVARSRRVEAELVWHLAEVDARKLYLREACSSMHVYATSRLHLSDAEAFLRIRAARVSRRFPVVLRMLADGRIHLSAIAKLSPHLRDTDGEAVLARAVHRSKREIDLLVAELAPKPDAPPLMRRLPTGRSADTALGEKSLRPDAVIPSARSDAPDASARADTAGPCSAAAAETMGAGSGVEARAGSIAPLAVLAGPGEGSEPTVRYKVQFTAGTELHDKIARAQALLRHQIPDGDLAAVVDRAMSLLVRELERARFAATDAPRKREHEADPAPSSRRIPAPIRRAVWERDGGQCAFRDRHGRRCQARDRLEFHHRVPFAQGGDHSASNVSLRCSAHNAYQAELDYGADFMSRARAQPVGPLAQERPARSWSSSPSDAVARARRPERVARVQGRPVRFRR